MIGLVIKDYRVVREIGRGGMGTVYEAVHQVIGQRAAIKVLHPKVAADEAIARRFFNEARALVLIGHPGVVRIHDFGRLEGGLPFLTMEFLEGESLYQRLAGGALALGPALALGQQVAATLAVTHQKGIVHRDLKPDNVFIVPDPAVAPFGERTKLLDFGIAKLLDPATDPAQGGAGVTTATSVLMGTPLYMAPEQCLGAGGVDEKADVYALGVMLYEMLAGRPPFAGPPGALLMAHLREEPPPLRDLAPALPEAVAAQVHRLLAKRPEARPKMAELAEALGRLLAAARADPHAGGADPARTRRDATPVGARTTLGAASGQTQATRRLRTGMRLAAMALAGGLVAGGAVLLRAPRQGPRPEAAAAVVPPPLATVSFRVSSEPPGAQVLRATDLSPLGTTPFQTERAQGEVLEVVVRHSGYVDRRLRLDCPAGCEEVVKLTAVPPVKPPVRTKPARTNRAAETKVRIRVFED